MGFVMRIILVLVMSFASILAFADTQIDHYYGADFITGYQNKTLKNDDLKNLLFTILSGGHIKRDQQPDEIVSSCAGAFDTPLLADTPSETSALPAVIPETSPKRCVQHTALGYSSARVKLFGQLFLKQNSAGQFAVKDVYCEKDFTDDDFKGNPTFGPGMLPSSGNIINTEHTWPQSRFTGRFPRELQKSDLHHLFPTDSQMNGQRGSLRFGYVVDPVKPSPLKCPQNKFGHQENGEIIFEVPDSQKGNTARAIFYFATRYQMKLSDTEEAALRRWDKFDPVDTQEADQNSQINDLQGNRNPFIDYSDLIDSIDQF
jgi:deoxyribonuclease I